VSVLKDSIKYQGTLFLKTQGNNLIIVLTDHFKQTKTDQTSLKKSWLISKKLIQIRPQEYSLEFSKVIGLLHGLEKLVESKTSHKYWKSLKEIPHK
jgi:hypothetical protein